MSTTQEITVRIAKTIQEQQYEPITAEVIIKETCPKKKYDERLDELLILASNKVFAYLGDENDQLESGEDYEEGQDRESVEENPDEEGGKEGFESGSDDEGEEGFEEGGEESGEFEDFFEDESGEVD